MQEIRRANKEDISRIAEILVFTKRVSYRPIFQNDQFSFINLQVLPLAQEYQEDKGRLGRTWVFDDGFVKGMLETQGEELTKLYVDSFFHGMGIGAKLMDFAVSRLGVRFLWALEKNKKAIAFYCTHGFERTGERMLEEGTPEYLVEMERR